MSRLPPGTQYVVVAALGALALGVGAVATIDGNLWGIPLAVGGAVLLYWSVKVTRKVLTTGASKRASMAARKKKRPLRPRTPSRVKKRTTKKKARARAAHEHPELIGLGLAAVGLFLASLLYLRWEGGVAGEKIEAGLRDAIGSAAYAAPLALVVVGALMLFRSALLDVKPFRTGLAVTTIGLMVTLGGEHGGAVGNVLGGGIAKLLGGTGSVLLGLTALLAGGLLLSGASYGAVLRRSHHAVRRAVARPERALKRDEAVATPPVLARHEPPIDVVHDYPDVISEGLSEPSPLLIQPDDETEEQTALFDVPRAEGEYVLPDRAVLKVSPPAAASSKEPTSAPPTRS